MATIILSGVTSEPDEMTLPADAGAELPAGGEPARERKLRAQGKKTLGKLLDAGVRAFERNGYHNTTVDDVVSIADTSRGTFYLYFSNKDDLLSALAHNVADEAQGLIPGLGGVGPDEAGFEALRVWLDQFATVYDRYGPVVRAWQEAETSEEFAALGMSVLTEFSAALVAQIADACAASQTDPQIAALALISMLERFNYLLSSRRLEVDRDVMLDTLARIVHAGFFGARPAS